MPKEYQFLLAGLALGLLFGWLAGRRMSQAQAPLAEVETPPVAEPAAQAEGAGIKLVVNGNTVEVPPAAMAEVQAMIKEGQKTEAAKVLRDATGMNLAAAKSVVASLEKVLG